MRKIVYAMILGVAGLSVSSCRSLSSDVLAGEWDVVELNGTSITPSERTPFLGFDVENKTIYGFSGCNRLSGGLDLSAFLSGKSEFGNVASTRMLCADDIYENDFFTAFGKVSKQRYAKGKLLLMDKDDKVLMRLQKRK